MIKDALCRKIERSKETKDTKIIGFLRNKGCLLYKCLTQEKEKRTLFLILENMAVGKNGF